MSNIYYINIRGLNKSKLKDIEEYIESKNVSIMFVSEHWFPIDKYYQESRYYLCTSKLEKMVKNSMRGIGGIMVFVKDDIRQFIKRIDYSHHHHVTVEFKNDLKVTGVYWRKSMSIEKFKKSLMEISEIDILLGDVNLTQRELETKIDEKASELSIYLNRTGLFIKNSIHENNKLDHIFISKKYYQMFNYNYYKYNSDHPIIELLVDNEYKKSIFEFSYIKKKNANLDLLNNDTSLKILSLFIDSTITRFENSKDYNFISNNIDLYDESIYRIINNSIITILGYKTTIKTRLEPTKQMNANLECINDNIFKKFKLIKRMGILNEIQPNNDGGNVYRDTVNHYKEIFNKTLNDDYSEKMDEIFNSNFRNNEDYTPFTMDELHNVLKSYPNNKTAGLDGITKELLIYLINTKIMDHLLSLFNLCWKKSYIPISWNNSIVHPIAKDSNSKFIQDFRPISLTLVFRRLFELLIKDKIFTNEFIDTHLHPLQTGFRSKYSTSTQIIYLNDAYNLSRNMIKVFIDFKNAYDSVIIEKLLIKLSDILDVNTLFLLKSMFLEGKFAVKVNGKRTSYIKRTNGLMQGSVLSPILFNFYVNDLCIDLNINIDEFRAVFYADDLVLLSPSVNLMNRKMNILSKWCSLNGLNINISKCGVIGSKWIIYDDLCIPFVEKYKYLGIYFDKCGIIVQDTFDIINEKIDAIIKITSIISYFLTEEEMVVIFKSYILPYFDMYLPLLYFKVVKVDKGISSYNKEINKMNKKLSNWLFSRKTVFYNILFSICGLLNVKEYIYYLSIRFKYQFMNIKEKHPMHNLICDLHTLGIYNNSLLSYKINTLRIDKFQRWIFYYPRNHLVDYLKIYKEKKLCKNKLASFICTRLSNGMDPVLKIKNPAIRSKLLNWRRYKTFSNYLFRENGKMFSRKGYNEIIYPSLIDEIDPLFLRSYSEYLENNYIENYTIIDHLINSKEYDASCNLIELTRPFLKRKKNNVY